MSYTKTVATEIACNDEGGKEAYMERKKREEEQVKNDTAVELNRIQNTTP